MHRSTHGFFNSELHASVGILTYDIYTSLYKGEHLYFALFTGSVIVSLLNWTDDAPGLLARGLGGSEVPGTAHHNDSIKVWASIYLSSMSASMSVKNWTPDTYTMIWAWLWLKQVAIVTCPLLLILPFLKCPEVEPKNIFDVHETDATDRNMGKDTAMG